MTQAPEFPSATIRRAAAQMKADAEAATGGPWRAVSGTWGGQAFPAVIKADGDPRDPDTWLMATGTGGSDAEADAAWAASMNPLLGLDLAELLEQRAAEYDQLAGDCGVTGAWFVAGEDGGDVDPVIKLARRYLGEAIP